MSCPAARSPPRTAYLLAGAPAGHDKAQHREHREGHDVEQAQVEVTHHHVLGYGYCHPEQKRRHKDGQRRQPVHPPVGPRGQDVLLGQQLHGVRDGLKRPVEPHAHRPHTHLDAGQGLPLDPRKHEHHHGEEEEEPHPSKGVPDGLRDPDVHRSTSPRMMSMEPRITTASAT